MKKILSVLIAMVLLISAVSCLSVGALGESTADEVTGVNDNVISGRYELGAVVVSLKQNSPSIEDLLADFEITESRLISGSSNLIIYYVKFAEKTEEIVKNAIAVLSESPYVNYVEPNYLAYLESVDNTIDSDTDLQIRKDAYENFYNGRVDFEDIVITYFGALSDGTPVVNVNYNGKGCLNAYMTDIVGDYYYSYDICCERAYIYRDNDFVFIEDAYDTGLIGDKNLAELCEISKEYSKHIYNDCCFYFYPINDESDSETTEPTTQPETTIAEETKPTSLEDVKSSTSDTPEIKTSASSDTAKIANANGSNGTVQTGQSNSLILLTLLLIVLATTTAVFIKFRCRD